VTPPRFCWREAAQLAGVIVLLALPQIALLPLLDRDEPRFAEASREMIQSGDYIIPTFNGAPRYAKPPLIYWCQAAAFRVFGENPFAARLPSVLATAATALVLLAWGAALGSRPAGVIAGLAYALCFQAMQQGRVATADGLLVFFMALSGYAGWRLLRLAGDPGAAAARAWRGWGCVLALALAGGLLAKGPEALLAVLPVLFMVRWSDLRTVLALKAMVWLALLLFAAWGIPALVESHGDFWRVGIGHDVVDRGVTGFQGHGASSIGGYLLLLPLYLLTFWISALPWSPLIIARRRALMSGPWDQTDRYLAAQAALVFVVFTLMATKLPHYTLPAIPFLALLFGRCWIRAGYGWGALAGGLIAFGAALAVIALVVIPLTPSPSPTGELVRAAGAALMPETQVALVDFNEPNAVWELRRVVRGHPGVIPADEVPTFLMQDGPRAVLLSTAQWENLQFLPQPDWQVVRATGWNAARLSRLDLTLVVKR
jgi:4-amino-4-deoxy-L-arabinose transferase-like glycosyltransferase